jgi:hypothetical protein
MLRPQKHAKCKKQIDVARHLQVRTEQCCMAEFAWLTIHGWFSMADFAWL